MRQQPHALALPAAQSVTRPLPLSCLALSITVWHCQCASQHQDWKHLYRWCSLIMMTNKQVFPQQVISSLPANSLLSQGVYNQHRHTCPEPTCDSLHAQCSRHPIDSLSAADSEDVSAPFICIHPFLSCTLCKPSGLCSMHSPNNKAECFQLTTWCCTCVNIHTMHACLMRQALRHHTRWGTGSTKKGWLGCSAHNTPEKLWLSCSAHHANRQTSTCCTVHSYR